ncbi:hypothetical protein [Serratia proteamaculans]|uniref:hypothetical protein n=1 Tax=Serratia proteamaculans TaxID=28151 RepID=UPI002179D34D|nr:hypothetical protein [Serratia proteamaculans]CAI1688919.1 Uncharacterised protein [Serratia proteamaculans]
MPLSDYQKQLFRAFLSGTRSPFPGIYDAVSEQLLLLIFKARQLNAFPEYSNWFAEQHRVLAKLRTQSDKISSIYLQDNFSLGAKQKPQDSLYDALSFMYSLYEGFDQGNVSMKTWGDMNHPPTSRGGGFQQQAKVMAEFIRDDLFAILTESKTGCSPIPEHMRKGYCHHDLSIAHSCSDVLLERLDDYHKINTLHILAETICDLIDDFRHKHIALPVWLSQFDKACQGFSVGELRESYQFEKVVALLEEIGREQFIEGIIAQCTEHDAERIFNRYVGIYATDIHQWISDILCYLKTPQSTPYRWKFTTSKPENISTKEETEHQESIAWDSDYCQISISRDNLLMLIQTNTLYDATVTLADCLLHIYKEPAEQGLKDKDTTPPITEKERNVYNSNSWVFPGSNRRSREENASIIQSFEHWYNKNKVLLVTAREKRTEKISVAVRLAGLKCYDLKMGIPEGNKMRIKDGVYGEVKKDSGLRFHAPVSDVSLQRYHTKVKRINTVEIDLLIQEQRNKNTQFPYSGALRSIKPLWEKCSYVEGE